MGAMAVGNSMMGGIANQAEVSPMVITSLIARRQTTRTNKGRGTYHWENAAGRVCSIEEIRTGVVRVAAGSRSCREVSGGTGMESAWVSLLWAPLACVV